MHVEDLHIHLLFSNVFFLNNHDVKSGSCIFAASYLPKQNKIHIVLKSVKAHKTAPSNHYSVSPTTISSVSLFHFSDINNITISGSAVNPSNFSFNIGTVIEAVRSHITLKGHIVFHNNTGINGAAIMLIGDSLIYLIQGLQANFTNNKALSSGGAIYAHANEFDEIGCTFQINTTEYDDIAILFENNKATVTGNSVYSSKLYECFMSSYYWINSTLGKDIYKSIFTIIPNNTYEISTTPVNLTICNLHEHTLFIPRVYPGETINFLMAAINAVGHHSRSTVTVTAAKKGTKKQATFTHINWWFSEEEYTQVIKETKNCTLINITIHTNDSTTLDMQPPCYHTLLFTIPSIADITMVEVDLKSCPPGFKLDFVTGTCVCSHILSTLSSQVERYIPNCNINTKTFNRPFKFNSWAGVDCNEIPVSFLFSLHCPYSYCNGNPIFSVFRYSNNLFTITTKDLRVNSSLCLNNREGILCSKCSTVNGVNYSVVFGSTECRQCSNWWLWTLVLYAVAGPLLIYLLYALRLTLASGTLNGIIFYTQVANAGLYDILSTNASQYSWAIRYGMKAALFVISIMNLNLGFPLCFYNGMTELWKAGFSLLFPLYLLTIVVVLIILSRFSLRLSNRIAHSSVQVLVTVVHLSFSKLLLSIINAFTSVQLYNSTMNEPINVWHNDGSVTYGDTNHMKLMIVTSVIVGIFLIPYMLIILTGRLLMKSNKIREYLRPIYEAIHAPYKYNKQYWFTARQLLLIFVFIVYTIYRGRNDFFFAYSFILPIYSFFVALQAYLKPFKSKIINILDLSVMINIGVIMSTNWYFLTNVKYICAGGIFDAIFVYILMFTFSVVVFYHIVLVTGQQARFISYINVAQYSIKKMTQYLNKNSKPVSYQRRPREDFNSSFFDDSYSEYREPLMSP